MKIKDAKVELKELRHLDLEITVSSNKMEILKYKGIILKKISMLECSQLRTLLYMRYSNGMYFKEIASSMDISIRFVHKMHSKALMSYCKINLKGD
jgi:DNA-directed RNA polymerase specialized sigma subunit